MFSEWYSSGRCWKALESCRKQTVILKNILMLLFKRTASLGFHESLDYFEEVVDQIAIVYWLPQSMVLNTWYQHLFEVDAVVFKVRLVLQMILADLSDICFAVFYLGLTSGEDFSFLCMCTIFSISYGRFGVFSSSVLFLELLELSEMLLPCLSWWL